MSSGTNPHPTLIAPVHDPNARFVNRGGFPRAMNTHRHPSSFQAFTLVELLVVLVIMGILAGLILPVMSRAKSSARNAVCLSNLRQLGIAVRGYAEDRNAILPAAEVLPTQPTDPKAPLPRICDVLASEWSHSSPTGGASSGVFRCPSDRPGYFQREGSSYEWNVELNGRRLDETRIGDFRMVNVVQTDGGDVMRSETNGVVAFPPATTPLLFNYLDFHPRPPRSGKNAVYMDGHVESLDAMLR